MQRPLLPCWLLIAMLAALPIRPVGAESRLRLSTTTSTEESGLLAAILPRFEQRFGIRVEVIAVGSGKALKLAENGDVDAVLSHAPELERRFLEAGLGVNPRSVMENDFVLVGPPSDPAGVRNAATVAEAMGKIAAARAPFLSRGDESGTHQKEKALWRAAGIEPKGEWYLSAGLGMGEVLRMAQERRAYTLSDRGTFAAYRAKGDLAIVHEGDPALANPYTVIAVNPARHRHVHYVEAMILIAWLTSPEGQEQIGAFRVGGQALFRPTAIPPQ